MTKIYNRSSEKDLRRRLRNQMPKAEALLWSKLKGKQLLGQRFRRQYSVGPYVVDFYCPTLKLAIELDGDSHYRDGAQENDARRQKYIESFQIQALRFLNDEIFENLDGVWQVIAQAVEQRKKQLEQDE